MKNLLRTLALLIIAIALYFVYQDNLTLRESISNIETSLQEKMILDWASSTRTWGNAEELRQIDNENNAMTGDDTDTMTGSVELSLDGVTDVSTDLSAEETSAE